MTVNYVQAHGGGAERNGRAWNLTWPGGESLGAVVFSSKDAGQVPAARHLTLEEPRVRGLATRIPRFAPGQPIPRLSLKGLPNEVRGFWSLWANHVAHAGLEPPPRHAGSSGTRTVAASRPRPGSCGTR